MEVKVEQTEIVIKNESDVNVGPFPIDVPMLDKMGRPQIDGDTQMWKLTGENALKWELEAGETSIFPRYVGEYLLGIYAFLKEVPVPEDRVLNIEGEEEPKQEPESITEDDAYQQPAPDGKVNCKFCTADFDNVRGLGMHMAHKHPEMLVK